ncbi:MAG: mechanosensitive ion channel family protein [Tenericutes bacterium]|nr:mechanosensitive ion channel family protein [Mycoplasmatota bacterium]
MFEKLLMKDILVPIIIIVISILAYAIAKNIIKKVFKVSMKTLDAKRKNTLMMLFTNVVKFFIIAIASISLLESYGIDTKSLIASLGVFAAVIALALQDLLKDFVAGITIFIEGQYHIGDIITIGDFKGEVIAITLKTTRVQAYTGEIKIFANRNITEVVNHTLDNSLAIVDINVAYDSDLEKVDKILTKLCERLTEELDNLKGPVVLLGLNQLNDSSISYRIVATTVAMQHFVVQRAILKAAILELNKNNIEIPFQQVVLHNGK